MQKQKEYGIILANMISVPVRVRPEGGQIAKRTLCIPGRGHARRICFHRIGVREWGNEIREKRSGCMEMLILGGGLLIIIVAVIVAAVSSVVSAVAASEDEENF